MEIIQDLFHFIFDSSFQAANTAQKHDDNYDNKEVYQWSAAAIEDGETAAVASIVTVEAKADAAVDVRVGVLPFVGGRLLRWNLDRMEHGERLCR
jgi:hypothetical protein